MSLAIIVTVYDLSAFGWRESLHGSPAFPAQCCCRAEEMWSVVSILRLACNGAFSQLEKIINTINNETIAYSYAA